MKKKNNRENLIRAYRDGEMTPERNGMYWTEAERVQLITRFREGIGITDLSLELQRTENGIVQQLMAHNLLTAPDKRRVRRKKKCSKCLCDQCDYEHCPRETDGEENEPDA